MDPFSIAATVCSLVATCYKITNASQLVISKYQNAKLTMSSIDSECSVVRAALSRIQALVLDNSSTFSSRLKSSTGLSDSLESVLTTTTAILSKIDKEVEWIIGKNGTAVRPGHMARVRQVWNEQLMDGFLQDLGAQKTSITMLFTVLNREGISDIQIQLQGITNLLHETRPPQHRPPIEGDLMDLGNLVDFDDHPPAQPSSSVLPPNPFRNWSRSFEGLVLQPALSEQVSSSNLDKPSKRQPEPVIYQPALSSFLQSGSRLEDPKVPLRAQASEPNLAASSRLQQALIPHEPAPSLILQSGSRLAGHEVWSPPDRTCFARPPIPNPLSQSELDGLPELRSPENLTSSYANQTEGTYTEDFILSDAVDVSKVKRLLEQKVEEIDHLYRLKEMQVAADVGVCFLKQYIFVDLSDDDWEGIRVNVEKGKKGLMSSGYGYTALHILAEAGIREYVEVLLANGADIEAETKDGMTPLHLSSSQGHVGVTELLLNRGANVKAKMKNSNVAMHIACWKGHSTLVKMLLGKNADINAKGENGWVPLHYAVAGGNSEVTRVLINRGAKIGTQNDIKDMPLHIACAKGYQMIVGLLLAAGADVESQARNNRTPLHDSCLNQQVGTAILLVERGAKLEKRVRWCISQQGSSGPIFDIGPLQICCIYNAKELAEFLLDRGADMQAGASKGISPLCLARRNGNDELAKILSSRGAT